MHGRYPNPSLRRRGGKNRDNPAGVYFEAGRQGHSIVSGYFAGAPFEFGISTTFFSMRTACGLGLDVRAELVGVHLGELRAEKHDLRGVVYPGQG